MTNRVAPIFYIRCLPDGVGGPAPRVEQLGTRVESFVYTDTERRADKVTFTVDNFDLELTDDPAFKRGMQIEVSWGYPGRMAPTRTCVVTKISGARKLQIEASARSVLLNTIGRTRTFQNVRRSDVIRTIATEAGYGSDSIFIDETPTVYETIVQSGMTDAAFIVRLGHMEGFDFYVDQDGFHWHSRRLGQAPTRVFTFYTDRVGEVIDFNVENDISARPGRTRVRGRDRLERTDIDVTADDSTDRERDTLSPIRIVVDPETRGTRIEADIGAEEVRTTTAPDAATAARQARARFRRIQLTAIKMKMTIIGDPLMLAKTIVETRGMGQRLSTRYYVKEVSHTIDGGGYVCALSIVSDGDGGHSTTSRAARGLELLEPGPVTSGRPNTAEPIAGAEESGTSTVEGAPLEAVTSVDPETRAVVTTYREPRRAPPS